MPTTGTRRRGRARFGRAAITAQLALIAGCAGLSPGPRPAPVTPATCAGAACADSLATAGGFYGARPYGSEAQFNPLSQVLNEGFDMLRMDGADRRVDRQLPAYRLGLENSLRSVLRPDRVLAQYGWERAVRNELLPLTFTSRNGGGAWVPNYTFHLVGSGMVSARMTEWFRERGYAHAGTLSFLTMTVSHLLNEAVENGTDADHYSMDALADLLVFDPGGFLLFRSERVRRFFSERVQLTNWPLQPAWVLPGNTLENAGQLYVLRAPIPGTKHWRLFHGFGINALLGVSRTIDSGYAISLAAGEYTFDVDVVDEETGAKTVRMRPHLAAFLDREGSLLLSVVHSYGREVDEYGTDAAWAVNLYPGVVRLPGVGSPGAWVHVLRRGGVRLGFSTRAGLGLGVGPEQ